MFGFEGLFWALGFWGSSFRGLELRGLRGLGFGAEAHVVFCFCHSLCGTFFGMSWCFKVLLQGSLGVLGVSEG